MESFRQRIGRRSFWVNVRRRLVYWLVPPLFVELWSGFRERFCPWGQLLDGHNKKFQALLAGAKNYGEYGCGRTTCWVLSNTQAQVMSVDTDILWIDRVRGRTIAPERLNAIWIDVGRVGPFGRPIDYSKREYWEDYTDCIWRKESQKPDLVLIDGRFRVCCFFTALKFAEPGTQIVFDDYGERPHYHIVEEFLAPYHTEGRVAFFIVPNKSSLNMQRLDEAIERFRYVMD